MGELGARKADPPFTSFPRDMATLHPHPCCFLKISLESHFNEEIRLPVFYPKPHASREETSLRALDARRVLAFYLDRTKSFRPSSRLFVSFSERMKAQHISTQRHSKWVLGRILTYESARVHAVPS